MYRINTTTQHITRQHFILYPQQKPNGNGKLARFTYTVDFAKTWSLKCFFTTPRDMVTWLTIQHRNLFTASRNDQTNGICRACGWELENQIHLARCRIINRGTRS